MPRFNFNLYKLDRRDFVRSALIPAAMPLTSAFVGSTVEGAEPAPNAAATGDMEIIDTNVHLFEWPFRKLKYDRTETLVAKLRKHRITQAWAGSFEAVLQKQLDATNRRLAEECKTRGSGMLIPIGSLNPAWPDWLEDLDRCHRQYKMPGVRLYPSYHGYALDHAELPRLLVETAKRGMLVQIAIRLEDIRVHHVAVTIPDVSVSPLADVLRKVPEVKVQLINAVGSLLGNSLAGLVRDTKVTFDIAATEGNGGVGRVIEGKNSSFRGAIPVERLLFGSHAPFFPCESAVMKLIESPLRREQLEKLMGANARKLIAVDLPKTSSPLRVSSASSPLSSKTDQSMLNPAAYGLPTRDELVKLRIWDIHYHGFYGAGVWQHEENLFYVERMGIERMLSLDIAGTPTDPLGTMLSADKKREIRDYLEKHSDRVSGLIPIDPSQPVESCQKIDEWIRNGPCVGIKYYGGNPGGVVCSHPNNDAIIRLAAELGALIYIHTWMKIGGTPRRPGGDNEPGESTPMDVALLAERFPQVPLICGHSGGDWELGVRAVRPHKNVYIEFSGSDPHSGQVDYTVSQIGVNRLIWGGHGPSRCYSTELAKVLDGDLTHADRLQIFGGNLRQLAAGIFKTKGYRM